MSILYILYYLQHWLILFLLLFVVLNHKIVQTIYMFYLIFFEQLDLQESLNPLVYLIVYDNMLHRFAQHWLLQLKMLVIMLRIDSLHLSFYMSPYSSDYIFILSNASRFHSLECTLLPSIFKMWFR